MLEPNPLQRTFPERIGEQEPERSDVRLVGVCGEDCRARILGEHRPVDIAPFRLLDPQHWIPMKFTPQHLEPKEVRKD